MPIEYDKSLAAIIDHTLLKPDATRGEIERLCTEALQYQFASVCINPSYVQLCSDKLSHATVKVCTVIGFPLGATSTAAKIFEAEQAIRDGASEIDMVLNVGYLKSGNREYVENDIRMVTAAVHVMHAMVKVILETCLLTDAEKETACHISKAAGTDFVKTSTGFSKGGATVEDIALMRKIVGPAMGVKASGGVRTQEQARRLVAAGANRIGASASITIVTGEQAASATY